MVPRRKSFLAGRFFIKKRGQSMDKLKDEALQAINDAESVRELSDVRNVYLSKKGSISTLMSNIRDIANDKKREYGARVNALKDTIENALSAKLAALEAKELSARLARETIDITLPGRTFNVAPQHPFHIIKDEISDIDRKSVV